MSLAEKIASARGKAETSLEELANAAEISKTYLWQLENDKDGKKKPSADVLLRIADALDLTIADLLSLPTVQVNESNVDISPSLREFRDWMKKTMKKPLTADELRDLATMRFRGGQPKTREAWFDLYSTLSRTTE